MQQERGAAIRITFGRHVHIGHGEPLAVGLDHEHVYRVGIGETRKRDAERLLGKRAA